MKKNKIYAKLETFEERFTKVVDDLNDFLHTVDDVELSELSDTFREITLDFLHDNDTVTLDDIRDFIEDEYDPE